MAFPWASSIAAAVLFVLPVGAVAAPKKAAEDWSHAFSGDAALQIRDPLRVAVVAAGGNSGAAAEALLLAVKASGFKTVDVPATLQNDAAKNDHGIVRSLQAAGVKPGAIAIVRVYPGVKDGRKTAVALVYDRNLAIVSSLVGEEGKQSADQSRALAEQQYTKQILWYGTYMMPEPGTIAINDQYNVIFQGTGNSRRAIGWGEFYRLAGRPDLSAKYRRRLSLSYGAVAIGTVGLVAWVLADDFDWRLGAASTALLAGGALSMRYANPLSRGEARRMIEDHNSKLRVRLGLAYRDGSIDPEVSLALRF